MILVISVGKAIEDVTKLKWCERVALLEAFLNDVDFPNRYADENFQFLFPLLDEAPYEAGKALLVSFYDRIIGGIGFTGLDEQQNDPLNQHQLW